MTRLVIVVLILVILRGWISFILNNNHLLVRLLRLEILAIGIYFTGLLIFISLGVEAVFMVYYLVIVVREGALGLSLLIVVSYNYGRDYMRILRTLLC